MESQLLSAHMESRDVETVVAAIIAGHPRPLTGVSPQGIPKILAAWLEWWPHPATGLLEYLSGTKLHLQVLAKGERALTDAEHCRLYAGGLRACRYRNGLLRTSRTMAAASCSLIWLPARLPYDVCRELDAGTKPAGTILAPLGMRREDRRAMATCGLEEVTGADAAVISTALLTVDGKAVGIAGETITKAFAESLTRS